MALRILRSVFTRRYMVILVVVFRNMVTVGTGVEHVIQSTGGTK